MLRIVPIDPWNTDGDAPCLVASLDGSGTEDHPLDLPLEPGEDDLAQAISEAARFFLQHPTATQALVAMLAAEGRRFATTDQGQRWRSWLTTTGLSARAQELWDASPLKLTDGNSSEGLPAALAELLARAASRIADRPAPDASAPASAARSQP